MKIILKHILRNLKDNKKRTFLIGFSLLIIGLFVSFISSFGFFLFNMLDVLVDGMSSGYDYELVDKDGEPINEEQITTLNYDFDTMVHLSGEGYLNIKDKEYNADIYGMDLNKASKFGFIKKENGGSVKLNDFEIVVIEELLDELDLSIGDKVKFISDSNKEFELTIKDTVKDSTVLSFMDETYPFAVNMNTYKQIFNEPEEYYDYFIIFNNEITEEELKQFKEDCELNGLKVVDMKEEAELMISDLTTTIIPVILFFILILCIVVYFVNKSFLRILLNERIPMMGTFRSLGATRKKVNFILMLEMALYGLLAGVVGTVLGVSIVKIIVKLVFVNMLSEEIVGFDFGVLVKAIDNNIVLISLISIAFVTLFQLFLSHKEISESSKKSIKDCIFSKYDDIYVHKLNSVITGISGLIIIVIALLFKEKENTLLTILAIIALIYSLTKMLPFISKFVIEKIDFKSSINKIATRNFINSKLLINSTLVMSILFMVIISLISMAEQEKYDVKSEIDNINFDLILEASTTITEEDLVEIKSMDEVEDVIIEKINPVLQDVYIANNKVGDLSFVSISNLQKMSQINKSYKGIEKFSENNLKDNEVIISKEDAKEYDLKENDEFYISLKKSTDNYEVELPVYVKLKGTHEHSDGNVIVSEKLYNDMEEIIAPGSTSVYFELKEGSKDEEVAKIINDIVGQEFLESEVMTLEEYKEYLEADASIMYIVMGAICLVLGVIVLLCIVNNYKISFEQRKKEFATMYSICMSRKQLKKMIKVEIIASCIVSILMAVIYSMLFIALFSVVLDGGFRLTIKNMIIIASIVLVIMYIVSIRIGKRIDKLNIIDEIKYE